ncbi:glycerol-3-phosphate 1-O-acyltransferase PlsY [Sandaracinobacteroides saxicola]|uniref:Glycerol-3-phosphate acyltransferase n=1 Tax=Sandaracinobacteroides saxicola TaxID=2759707 RepID=A0A7G5IGK6_9SPHN|nr:glycerol-3-phosphate 1-O-acyltransferase PlsY [Sandaracinobacteroides saxicola]QMW22498.1 glycerol-3-phosphate 1-O-acyltransferase PlsY [Sandaracinobacteroides saxicola]
MTALGLIGFGLALLLGYALGSIPFGFLLAKAGGAGDVRTIGSGNIGATNVLRTGRKGLAAATLLLDAGKGALAVWLGHRFGGETLAGVAGLGAFIGHLYSVWLRFRGGKGVATLLGISLALLPLAGLAFALAWVGAALVTRISSLGGMAGGFAAAIAAFALGQPWSGALLLIMAIWVLWTHRENIARLRSGTEPRIGRKAA